MWKVFISWLFTQEFYATNSFNQLSDFQFQMSPNEKYLRRNGPTLGFYEKKKDAARLTCHVAEEGIVHENTKWINSIAHRHRNARVQICDILQLNFRVSNSMMNPPSNEETSKAIIDGKALVA